MTSRSRRIVIAVGGLLAAFALIIAVQRKAMKPDTNQPDAAKMIVRDTMIIDGETPSCAECVLEASLLATVGTPDDREIPQRVPDILRDSRGRLYLVFNGWIRKPILRYDSTGKYLGVLGRHGQGPGEYRMTMSAFIGPGDSIYIWAGGRIQTFGPDGGYGGVRRSAKGTPFALVPEDGKFVYVTGPRRTWTKARDDFVLRIDSTGTARDSFPIFSAGDFDESHPVVAPGGDVWTHMRSNYRLERHGPDGRVKQLIGVTLPPAHLRPLMTRTEADSIDAARPKPPARMPSRPRVSSAVKVVPRPRAEMHMVVDSAGLLWIARNIAAPRWDTITVTPQFLSPDEAPGEATIPREQEDRMYNTVIEVIDPRRAQIIARTQLPFLGSFAAPGYVARVTADENGHYRTEVYRVVLRRRASGGR